MCKTIAEINCTESLEIWRGIGLLSWNINDISDKILGPKTSTQQFLAQLNGQQVFCLQETKAEVKIPGFECRNKLRPDSRSGGLCIGVHRKIAHLVEPVDTGGFPDIMAVKISGEIMQGGEDVILVNAYDSPPDSSYKTKRRKKGLMRVTLEDLSSFLSGLKRGTPYIIVGDMNARTGNLTEPSRLKGDIIDDIINGSFKHESYPMAQTRNSEDATINERGKRLLDFVSEADLKILNGSTTGDIFGKITCLRYNGNSVVDYMLVSNAFISHIINQHFRDINKTK